MDWRDFFSFRFSWSRDAFTFFVGWFWIGLFCFIVAKAIGAI